MEVEGSSIDATIRTWASRGSASRIGRSVAALPDTECRPEYPYDDKSFSTGSHTGLD
jgi:hypothetical protein